MPTKSLPDVKACRANTFVFLSIKCVFTYIGIARIRKIHTYRRAHFARVLAASAVLMGDHMMRVRDLGRVDRVRYDQHRCCRDAGGRNAARSARCAMRPRRAAAVLLVHAARTVLHATCGSIDK